MTDAALLREAWQVLGLDTRASLEDVRNAWRHKLKQVHPDVGGTKEEAQHVTNMRDVLVAWIEAGKPALERAGPSPDAACDQPRSRWQGFTWSDVADPRPQAAADADWRLPAWKLFAIWAALWLLTQLLVFPWDVIRRAENSQATEDSQAKPVPRAYSLPPCVGMDIFAETKAMLDGKCWPRRWR